MRLTPRCLTLAVLAVVLAGCSVPGKAATDRNAISAAPTSSAAGSGAVATSTSPGPFVGTWLGHGRYLDVQSDGSGVVSYRTYAGCPDSNATCGTAGTDDHVEIRILVEEVSTSDGAAELTARVLSSNDPGHEPGSKLMMTLRKGVVDSDAFGNFCAPTASPGTCGA